MNYGNNVITEPLNFLTCMYHTFPSLYHLCKMASGAFFLRIPNLHMQMKLGIHVYCNFPMTPENKKIGLFYDICP